MDAVTVGVIGLLVALFSFLLALYTNLRTDTKTRMTKLEDTVKELEQAKVRTEQKFIQGESDKKNQEKIVTDINLKLDKIYDIILQSSGIGGV